MGSWLSVAFVGVVALFCVALRVKVRRRRSHRRNRNREPRRSRAKLSAFPKAGNAYSVIDVRKTFPNAYASWSPAEDKLLRELFGGGKNVRELAVTFNRRPGAIRSRLRKLGLR